MHSNLHALLLYCLRLNKFEKCVTMYSLMVRPEIEKNLDLEEYTNHISVLFFRIYVGTLFSVFFASLIVFSYQ